MPPPRPPSPPPSPPCWPGMQAVSPSSTADSATIRVVSLPLNCIVVSSAIGIIFFARAFASRSVESLRKIGGKRATGKPYSAPPPRPARIRAWRGRDSAGAAL